MTRPRRREQVRLLTIVDRDRHGTAWPALSARLPGTFALTDLGWPVDPACDIPEAALRPPCAVLATGAGAWPGYQLAARLPETARLLLVDPRPPGGAAPAPPRPVAVTAIGTGGRAPERVAPLLAWRAYASGGYEVRLLPAPGSDATLFKQHLLDSLQLWWLDEP